MAHARIGRTAAVGVAAAATLVVTLAGGAPSRHRLLDEQIRTTLYPSPVFPMEYPWEYGTVEAADFDGDGRQDVAVAKSYNDVTVLRGNGDGTFEPGVDYQASDYPSHVRVADFNADGRADLAVTDGRGFRGVSVLLGRGDGTFLPKSDYATGDGPYSLAIGDLDGDGSLDMATANLWSNDVSVLLGRGDGTFLPQSAVAAGEYPDSIGIGDLDADGRLDLVMTQSGRIAILRGRGDGTFLPVVSFDPGFNSWALAVADLDGDGRLDLVARLGIPPSGPAGPGFAVLRGGGDGTFGTPTLFGWQTGGYEGIQSLAVHDLDADGHLDVVMPASEVAIAFGNGDGTFGPQEVHGHPGFATAVAFADFDSDGAVDIAAIHPQAGGISLLFNRGARTFGPPPAIYAAGDVPFATLLGDFNGDGHPDVVSLNRDSEDVSLLLGTGEGTLLPERRFPAGAQPRAMVADDFDGDARLDLAVALSGAGAVAILKGDGNGAFESPVLFPSGASPAALVSSDLDHDGDADLAVANGTVDSVSILIGTGNATFGAPVPYGVPGRPAELVADDFDADGDPDLVAGGCWTRGTAASGCPSDDSLWLLDGAGDGTFTVSRIPAFDSILRALVAGDLDGDGRSDLLVTGSWPAPIAMLRGRGDGTFEEPLVLAADFVAPLLQIADADGDGFSDVLAADFEVLTILFGNADGTFTDRRSFLGAWASTPGLGDLDGDGGLDVVLPLPSDAAVLVMLNQHAPDADGDGIPDPRDSCPSIANPDQDPAACLQEVVDVSVTLSSTLHHGSGTVSWRTTHEVTLLGFNIVAHDVHGHRVQLNDAMIRCEACVTGEGSAYRFLVPKHRGGSNLFVETICSSDCGGPWGPAVRN
jgi:hypothetical protein